MCAPPPGDTSPPTNLNSQAPDTLPSTPSTASPVNPKPRLFMTTRARTPAASALAIQISVGIASSSRTAVWHRARRLNPVTRASTPARGTVARIGQLAAVERETAASDTFVERRLHSLELRDPLLDAFRPAGSERPPVGAVGRAVARQFRKLRADLLQRQADLLREHDERDEAQN